MENISVIGLDLAKNVFQVHGTDARGKAVLKKKLRRGDVLRFFSALPSCLVGIEACGSAHYWGRELRALGHDVRLIPPAYVKPYLKRNKTDAADAEAIAEAVSRPSMRFVAIKSEEQQAVLARHSVRDLLIRQQTGLINSFRGLLAEYGIIRAQGRQGFAALREVLDETNDTVPVPAKMALQVIVGEIDRLQATLAALEAEIKAQCRDDETCQRLMKIEGVGPITASRLTATLNDLTMFRKSRDFAAWLGLTPKVHGSGGKDRLGKISKQGNEALRRLLVLGASAALGKIRTARSRQQSRLTEWVGGLIRKNKPFRLIAVALANKIARIVWALLSKNQAYAPNPA